MSPVNPIQAPLPINQDNHIGSQALSKASLACEDHEQTDMALSIEKLQSYLKKSPPEIVLHILSSIFLDSNFSIYKVLDVAEYKKGIILPEAWLGIYAKLSFLFEAENKKLSWLHQFKILQCFIDDAQHYGNKTLRQIFYGLNLTKNKNPNFTIEDGMRAGIISRDFLYPDNVGVSEFYQQSFLRWLYEKRERIFACLRWSSPQKFIPNILAEATKHHHLHVFKSAFKYTTTHKLYGKNLPCETALLYMIFNNQVKLTKYLLDKNPRMTISTYLLNIAVQHKYVGIVRLFLDKGMNVDAINRCDKTTLQSAIKFFYSFDFSSSSREYYIKKYQQAINSIHIIILLMRKAKVFNIEWKNDVTTLLHLPCYIPFSEESKWFMQYLLEQNPNSIHIPDIKGNTPLLCAVKEKNKEIAELLLRNGASHVPDSQGNTPLLCAVKEKNKEMIELLLKNDAITGQLHWIWILMTIAFQGSDFEIWKMVWQNRGKKARSQASLSRPSSVLSAPLKPNIDTSRDITPGQAKRETLDHTSPWKQMIHRIYIHARAVVLFIPHTFYTFYRHTLEAF